MSKRNRRAEFLMSGLVTVVTLALALGLIRWFAPTLLGISSDLIMVQSSKEVAPFYEGVFRREDRETQEYLINDPLVGVRAPSLYPDLGGMGPNDLLGFRNLAVPNAADIVVIGDSQTYGNNAILPENWPSLMRQMLPPGVVVYSMATGGWGAVQYLYAFSKALQFQPRLVIVAFYTGNDPIETVNLALTMESWRKYMAGFSITKEDIPAIKFPPPDNEHWQVEFGDGAKTGFTPAMRLISNMRHPAVDLGYEIMLAVARDIAEVSSSRGISPIFTIIPTKEFVFLDKIRKDEIKTIQSYEDLIEAESYRISWLENELRSLPGATYVEVTSALQEAALKPGLLYPDNINGHPLGYGYAVIATQIAEAVRASVPAPPQGLAISKTVSAMQFPVYIRNGQQWLVDGDAAGLINKLNPPVVESMRLSGLTLMGRIPVAELERLLAQETTAPP